MRYSDPQALTIFALLLTLVAGCSERPPEALDDSRVLRQHQLEEMVFGASAPCSDDEECESGVCYFGSCMGVLLTDRRWMQEAIASKLAQAVADGAEGGRAVVRAVAEIAADPEADLGRRARAVVVLEAIEERELLSKLASPEGDPGGRLGTAVAMALARLGDSGAIAWVAALTESADDAIALEAIGSLGRSGRPEALVPLLRCLGPSLAPLTLSRAIEALGRLNDPRAVGPLITFLEEAPLALRSATTEVLRSLTGARVGGGVAGWRRWAGANPPEPAPAVRVRAHAATEDLGIPTP